MSATKSNRISTSVSPPLTSPSLPADPDSQFETSLRLLAQAFEAKSKSMMNEIERCKGVVRDRDEKISMLESQVEKLTGNMSGVEKGLKAEIEEKKRLIAANTSLAGKYAALKKEASKLESFYFSIVNMVQHNPHSSLQTILDQSFGVKNGRSIILEDNLLEEYLPESKVNQTVAEDDELTTGDHAVETDAGKGITTAENSNILDEMYEDPEKITFHQEGPAQEMHTIQQRRHTTNSYFEGRSGHGRLDWSPSPHHSRFRGNQKNTSIDFSKSMGTAYLANQRTRSDEPTEDNNMTRLRRFSSRESLDTANDSNTALTTTRSTPIRPDRSSLSPPLHRGNPGMPRTVTPLREIHNGRRNVENGGTRTTEDFTALYGKIREQLSQGDFIRFANAVSFFNGTHNQDLKTTADRTIREVTKILKDEELLTRFRDLLWAAVEEHDLVNSSKQEVAGYAKRRFQPQVASTVEARQ